MLYEKVSLEKYALDWFAWVVLVETSHLNTDMYKLEYSKKKKAEPTQLILLNLTEKLELLIAS